MIVAADCLAGLSDMGMWLLVLETAAGGEARARGDVHAGKRGPCRIDGCLCQVTRGSIR
jgi:hypothetical protein